MVTHGTAFGKPVGSTSRQTDNMSEEFHLSEQTDSTRLKHGLLLQGQRCYPLAYFPTMSRLACHTSK